MKMSEDPVFEPINDIFNGLMASVARARDEESVDTNVKVALMQAFQRGQSDTLDRIEKATR